MCCGLCLVLRCWLFGCVLLLIFRSVGSFTSVLSVCVWWCYCFISIGFCVCLLTGLGGLV